MKKLLSGNFSRSLKIIILGLITFLFPHCSEVRNNTDIQVINVEKGLQKGGVIKLSDLCSSVEYIPLQTDSNSIIGSRPLLKVSGNSFFITYSNSDNCKVFDLSGGFRHTIGNKGKSKGEYISIRGFDLEEKGSNIAIRDFNKIVIYNGDGLFLKDILLEKINERGYDIENFVCLENGKYCTIQYKFKDDTEALSLIDDSGEILLWHEEGIRATITDKITIKGKTHIAKGGIPPYIYKFDNNIRYFSSNNDTIFSFSEDFKKSPVYIVDLGSFKNKVGDPGQDRYVKFMLSSLRETRNHIFFKFIASLNMFSYMKTGERIGYAVYDKKEGMVTALSYDPTYQATGLKNDIDNSMPFWPDVIIDNKMYQIVDAMTFIDMSLRFDSAKMKEIASHLSENSNPVIVAATFK